MVLLLAAPLSAHAQLGGLKKKLTKAADQATAAVIPAGPAEAFTEALLELTPDRLNQVIAGKQAGRRVADAPNGLKALRKQLADVDSRLNDLVNKSQAVMDAWDQKRSAMEACRDEAFRSHRQARKEEYRARMVSDQVFARKVGELSLAIQNAQLKADSALMRSLGKEVEALTALTAADSLAVDKACGSPADAPPAVREIAALEQQKQQLLAEIRKAEAAVSEAEQQASQMNAEQFGMAWERVQLYMSRFGAAAKQTGFSPKELQALAARTDELEQLLK
jgi:DNA repair exonuclease SbcCD ATPase subunit